VAQFAWCGRLQFGERSADFRQRYILTYTIVIPAYNESVRIQPTLHALVRHVQEQNWDAEILVVNDGSTDDTAEIVREYGKAHPQVLLVENPATAEKATACATACCERRAISVYLAMPIFLPDRGGAENFSTRLPRRRYRHRIALACAPNYRPSPSRSTASSLAASSIWLCE